MSTLDDYDGLLRWDRLDVWVAEHGAALPGSGPVRRVEPLLGGSQNPVFRMSREGGEFVLRRPPRRPLADGDKTMLREARILAALRATEVPHARLFAACSDREVIGSAFYCMALVDGFTPVGQLPPPYDADPSWRRAMAFSLIDAAGALDAVEPAAVGLADLSKTDGWLERQVARWRNQLDGYRDFASYGEPRLPGVDLLGRWLDAHRPQTCRIGLIHGDLQFPNTMFHHDEPRVAAIVDWELSALGDPLLDLGWILTSWLEPGDPPGREPQVLSKGGFPTRAELVERYAAQTGRDVTDIGWYFVLACYKLGIILEGTWARALAGQVPIETGEMLHDYASWLFAKGLQLIGESP